MTRMTSLTAQLPAETGSDASRTRTIASPDTRAEGKSGFSVGKSKRLLLVDERSDAEDRTKTLLGQNARLRGYAGEQHWFAAEAPAALPRTMQDCSAGKCIFYLGAQLGCACAGKGAKIPATGSEPTRRLAMRCFIRATEFS